MKKHVKSFYFVPILMVVISIAVIFATGIGKIYRWVPPGDYLWLSKELISFPQTENSFGIHRAWETITDKYDSSQVKLCCIEKLRKFLAENPSNPEYQFVFAFINPDSGEYLEYIHKAEALDPENPIYPYYLGLAYSGALTGTSNKVQKDSAFAAFARAAELAPDNAAVDLAKLKIFLETRDKEPHEAYLQQRDERAQDWYTRFTLLMDDGKEVIKEAMKKPVYRTYSAQTVSMAFRLLDEAEIDNLLFRIDFVARYPVEVNSAKYKGIKLFIENIGPYNSPERVYAVADTVISLCQFGLMMRDDPDRNFFQHNSGWILTRICLDVLGDLFLVNSIPVPERLAGLTNGYMWNYQFMTNIPQYWIYGKFFLDLDDSELLYFLVLGVCYVILLVLLIIFIISIILSFITRSQGNKGITPETRITAFFMALISMVVLFIASVAPPNSWRGLIPGIAVLLIGLGFLVNRIILRKKGKGVSFVVPVFLIFIALAGGVFSFTSLRMEAAIYISILAGIPIGMIFGAVWALRNEERKFASFWGNFCKLGSECIVIMTIILLISWSVVGRKMTRFMELDTYNMEIELWGPDARAPRNAEKTYGPHYIRNDGSYLGERLERIERLEEMFGKEMK